VQLDQVDAVDAEPVERARISSRAPRVVPLPVFVATKNCSRWRCSHGAIAKLGVAVGGGGVDVVDAVREERSSARSASAWRPVASAAAPKITRELSWPAAERCLRRSTPSVSRSRHGRKAASNPRHAGRASAAFAGLARGRARRERLLEAHATGSGAPITSTFGPSSAKGRSNVDTTSTPRTSPHAKHVVADVAQPVRGHRRDERHLMGLDPADLVADPRFGGALDDDAGAPRRCPVWT
jgi:hypothetical protein